ncbi:glycosyltransferase [Clostridium intestinale]|uniref:Glycosyltransferase n=1 Tax=Clostridium intestinale TaxID=36845 RepID=A0A7D6ZFA0_9CLOT|nr:glycosyltransferase [Clostridium intestinale]QLY78761.1 glycosyltransferase [Clostridium intestinale]
MKTSIVILTYNNLDYTKQCIESIREYTKNEEYELIVVDNLSTDGTREWLSDQEDIIKILNEENKGFPKGCNQGIEISTGDNILLLNNDVIVTKNWLSNLITCLYSDKTLGAVSLVTNSCSYYQNIETSYNSLKEMHEFANEFNKTNPELWEERQKLIGFCVLIKKEAVDKIGFLDEIYTPGNFEDDDYSIRLIKAGYRLLLCKDTFIHHYGGTSFTLNKKYSEILERNKNKFLEKWGFTSSSSMSIFRGTIDYLDDKYENILEINCGTGANLLNIKNKYPKFNFYGIEQNEFAREIAERYVNIVDNSEKYKNFFDAIIVNYSFNLEKLNLDQYKHLLKENGKIIFIIKNPINYKELLTLKENSINIENYINENKTLISSYIKAFETENFELSDIKGIVSKINNEDIKIEKDIDVSTEYYFCVFSQQKFINLFDILEEIDKDINLDKNFFTLINLLKERKIEKENLVIMINNLKNRSEILNTLGVLCYKNNIYDTVIYLFKKGLEQDEFNKSLLRNYGELLFDLGEYEMSLEQLEKIKEKDGDVLNLIAMVKEKYNYWLNIRFILRRIEFDIEVNQSTEAIVEILKRENVNKLISIINKFMIKKVYILNYLAINCFENGVSDNIIPLLSEALKLEPEDVDSNYNMGYVLYYFGEKNIARSYFDKIKGKREDLDQLINTLIG